jgi:hypothetical protein
MHPRGGTQVKPDGSFEIWRVDPGKYTLVAQVHQDGNIGEFASAPTPLEVGRADVENLQIQLLPVGDLKGQVVFEDEEARKPPSGGRRGGPGPERRVFLRGDNYQYTPDGQIKDDGSFVLTRVAPGGYRVSVTPPPVYVKSMTLGPANFDGTKLDLTAGVPDAPLVVHVASAKGAISGTVRNDKGPAGGVHVALAEESQELGFTKSVDTKEDGTYSFSNVAPGKYRLFLFDDADRDEVMMSLDRFDDVAEKIEIHDEEKVTKDLKSK